MSYTALYRKFRPDEFEEVKGQEHIVSTLKNQIKAERIGHAYLFCGTRGTGKTTVAKILAKAVNCDHPVDGSPCGECASCKSIAAGTSMNVIEIDAASNNGVDNIREIREEVAYSPTEGRYKVYIIDEVHMLSIGAFNALLKTLEEPPSYVIFILATTEVHKIPITILSRCQRYDFRRITIDTIAERLKSLMDREQIDVEERALRYVAKAADGSMRDALSLLDQCIAFYWGQTLTYDKVLEVLGAADTEVFSGLLRMLLDNNITGSIAKLEELIIQGRDLGQLATDFTWYLRNLLLVQSSDHMEDVLDVTSEHLELLKEESKMADAQTLIRYIRIFSELSNQLKYATQKRVIFEIALIKLCKPAMETDYASILERLSQIEKQLEHGVPMAQMPVGGGAGSTAPGAVTQVQEPVQLPKAIPEDVKQVVERWRSLIEDIPGMMKSYLKGARLSLGNQGQLLIVLEDEIAEGYLNKEPQKGELIQHISGKIGKEVPIEIHLVQAGTSKNSYPDLSKLIHMDIQIED